MRLLSQALGILDRITQAANIVGTFLIVMLVLVISGDVFGREVFGSPLSGVPEILSLSIVAIVFLQVPAALQAGRLTRSDGILLMLEESNPKLVAAMETAFEILGILVLLAIIYAHWPILVRSIERADFVGSVGNFTFPTWPVKLMILIGAVLMSLQFLARILRRFLIRVEA